MPSYPLPPAPGVGRRSVLRGLAAGSAGAAAVSVGTIGAAPSAYAGDAGDGARPTAPARPLPPPRSLDGRPAPDFDYSRPNRLPQE